MCVSVVACELIGQTFGAWLSFGKEYRHVRGKVCFSRVYIYIYIYIYIGIAKRVRRKDGVRWKG